jgi:hypothetical protein
MTGERKILPIVMADIAHAASPTERTVLDHGETGFSRLWAAFSSRPCQTRLNSGPITRTGLADVHVLLLTSLAPAKLMVADEVRIVRGFLNSGGAMLLTNNDMSREAIDAWVKLAREFGIQSHGSVLRITPQTGQRGGMSHVIAAQGWRDGCRRPPTHRSASRGQSPARSMAPCWYVTTARP